MGRTWCAAKRMAQGMGLGEAAVVDSDWLIRLIR